MKPNTVRRFSGQDIAPAQHLMVGVMPGSLLLTLDGELPVEHLLPGDRVITRDTGMAKLCAIHRQDIQTEAIRICGGALGDTRPERDVLVSADQQILLRDWRAKALFGREQVLARAQTLVDGEFIQSLGQRRMSLLCLEFDAAHILYVDGLELATATDTTLRVAA